MSAFAEGGRWALCICHVFGLQMISEARWTSVVTHFMSIVRADNFYPFDQTIWQFFKSEFAVRKSFIYFLSLSLFSPPCFSHANPASSSSSYSLSYSSATLLIKTTDAIDICKSNIAGFYFFLIPSVNRVLKKLTALKGCCVNKLLMS